MNKYFVFILFFLMIFFVGEAFSQNSKESKERPVFTFEYDEGATYGSAEKKSKKSRKKSKAKYNNLDFEKKIDEYHELMEANAKKYKKMHKQMEKPQYSDPAYFGHKKKPKKRKPGKRKLCKECNIVH